MWLSSQVNHRRCAVCWGPVVLKCLDGAWAVVCPRGCQPGGHVSEEYVEYRRAHDAYDFVKARANYPELTRPVDPATLEADRRALFEEE